MFLTASMCICETVKRVCTHITPNITYNGISGVNPNTPQKPYTRLTVCTVLIDVCVFYLRLHKVMCPHVFARACPEALTHLRSPGKKKLQPCNPKRAFTLTPKWPRHVKWSFDVSGNAKRQTPLHPLQMHTSAAANRIAAAFPRAKIIAILRDPPARAFSAWSVFNG